MNISKVLDSFNLAAGNTSVSVDLSNFRKYCIQAVWENVAGTANGTIKVQQSLDGRNFDQLKTIDASGDEVDFGIDINSAAGSASIEDKVGFTGKLMRLTINVGNITGGTLSVFVNRILN